MKRIPTLATLTCIALTSALLLSVGVASAHECKHQEGKKGHHAFFDRLDTNQDGKITRSESRKNADKRFARADTNKDGAITKAELTKSFEKRRAAKEEKHSKKGHPRHEKGEGPPHHGKSRKHRGPEAFFAKLDANKDGKITRAESRTASDQRFARLDKNKDGSVTPEEMRAGHREMKKEWRRKNKDKSAAHKRQRAPSASIRGGSTPPWFS